MILGYASMTLPLMICVPCRVAGSLQFTMEKWSNEMVTHNPPKESGGGDRHRPIIDLILFQDEPE